MKANETGKEICSIHNLIKRSINESDHVQTVVRVTGANRRIVKYLAENKDRDIFQRDIEKEFTITRSTASKIISLMEEKGLVVRQDVSYDGRLKKLLLTDQAMEMDTAISEHITRVEEQLIEGFSDDELFLLNDFLKRLKKNLI